MSNKKNVAFFHPDLGIGGAERLVLDAALGLKANGHDVTVYTTYHDPKRCFKETVDGTLKVKVIGQFFPRSICGFCHIIFATLRMIYLALRFSLFFHYKSFDVLVVDQVSSCIPFLKIFTGLPILFYCHFPDKLLATRTGFIRKLYRFPFDLLEEITTGMASEIVVNSRFTRTTFLTHFRRLAKRDIYPKVLYPTVATNDLQREPEDIKKYTELLDYMKKYVVCLSINRFEKKKNIALAVKAFAKLRDTLKSSDFAKCRLVLAGGYDPRLRENKEYMKELVDLVKKNKLEDQTMYLKSFSNTEKYILLNYSYLCFYTPENEHFGIVPIEAQFCGTPVIACNSGGPLESVADDLTGFLCDPKEDEFAKAAAILISDSKKRDDMGKEGVYRVERLFTFEVFAKQLCQHVGGLCNPSLKKKKKKK